MDNNITSINGMDKEELEKAKDEARIAENAFTLKFKTPFTYENIEYSELSFDLDSLTGRDSLDVERELSLHGTQVAVPAFSGEYIIRIAAKACTVPIGADAFEQMRLKDYTKVRNKIRNFLFSSEL